MSSLEFYNEILNVEKSIKIKSDKNKSAQKNSISDNIDDKTAKILEEIRQAHIESQSRQVKNIVLNKICPSLKACFVTSEMLFETDKKLLEKQFGISIINEYGASELGLIAFENPQGEWQINAETIFCRNFRRK